MKRLLLFLSCSVLALAVAPVISDGPRAVNLERTGVLIKWVTSDAAGATSTIGCTLSQVAYAFTSTCTVGAGDGSKFPVGSVVSVEGEHMLVTGQSGDTLTLQRGFDLNQMSVFSQQLGSITVTGGNVCTFLFAVPHLYTTGVYVNTSLISGISGFPSTITVDNALQFHASCPSSTNGTYSTPDVTVYRWPGVHAPGVTITNVGSDSSLCYGATTSYGTQVFQPAGGPQQSVNHWVYITGQTPGASIHVKVQSTPRTFGASSCPSPGANTVESADFVVTFPTTPTNDIPTPPGVTSWDNTDNLTYAADVVATSLVDLQNQINLDRGSLSDGNLNYRVTVPNGSNWPGNWNVPAKTGMNPAGTGRMVVENVGHGSLPAQGTLQCNPFVTATCINLKDSSALIPQIYTQTANPTLTFGAASTYVIVRGLHLTADPSLASLTFGNDFPVVTTFNSIGADNNPSLNPDHISLEQNIIDCPAYNTYCKGLRIHGTFLSVTGNYVGPVFGVNADQGAIQVDGLASGSVWVYNNIGLGSMTGYYQSDNGLNVTKVKVFNNWFWKPAAWAAYSLDYHITNITQAVTLAAGATTTVSTGAIENDVFTNKPVSFVNLGGSWAALNRKSWTLTGFLEDGTTAATGTATFVSNGTTAQIVTSAPHGFTTGDYVVLGGGHIFPCTGFATGDGAPVQVTVINATTFTVPSALTFSTLTGTANCAGANLGVAGPVFISTRVNATSFTITKNSSGFTGTNTAVLSYPEHHIIKNGLENKNCIQCEYAGNVVQNSWGQDQHGQLFTMTSRGPGSQNGWPPAQGAPSVWAAQIIRDVYYHDNIFYNGCTGVSVLGSDPISPTAMSQRVLGYNNLFIGISGTAANGSACNLAPIELNGGYEKYFFNHNTFQSFGIFVKEDYTSSFPVSANVQLTNNVINASAMASNSVCGGIGLIAGGTVPCGSYSWATGLFNKNVLYGCLSAFCNGGSADGWNFQKSYFYGLNAGSLADYQAEYWPTTQTLVGFAGAKTITGCTNAAPIVCQVVNTYAIGRDLVFLQDVGGTTSANNIYWVCPGTTGTQVVLCASVGNGAYTSGGSITCWLGPCATIASVGLGAGSNYLASVAYTAPGGSPYTTTGAGPASDGTTEGFNPTVLQNFLNNVVTLFDTITGTGQMTGTATLQ